MPRAEAVLAAPPVVAWDEWRARQWAGTRQGQHILFEGPTQSGKTLLCRKVTALKRYAVVLGTKPFDSSLDEYVKEGYYRIDHWPPTKADYRKATVPFLPGQDAIRLILWPKIVTADDLYKFNSLYRKCLNQIFVDGKWCVVLDEAIWLADRKGCDLGDIMTKLAFASASNGVSMHVLCQRPALLPPIVWQSCMQALLFHGGNTRDQRELASLGVYPPTDVVRAIQRLRGHQFLDLPCRGGVDGQATWAVSEVVKNG